MQIIELKITEISVPIHLGDNKINKVAPFMVESHCHCYKGGLFLRVYGEEHHCHTEWTVTNDILYIKPNIYIYIYKEKNSTYTYHTQKRKKAIAIEERGPV